MISPRFSKFVEYKPGLLSDISGSTRTINTGSANGLVPPSNKLYLTSELSQIYVAIYTDGLVQDCSNSIANALELLQSYTKLSI